ncbi:BZ3500_MvSof-1268-A1-R1_Chr2-3g05274 [Microbotryum saponariae]|uniref:BZ3500_MvSof-1268-A1-R1_Chr2-3g05274 protein n=1 Tax=Microbotryum saponariae TaxID=289078 RepID=A0A2X0KB82_9BASI|nr:BZ3500_MvSof-1268-A1-R1_Chr2-3g05274 [Microbotryum saponariae]SDA01100.1 BZ3501_MvSof-1269-A2-R1_Chr2-2g04947 [Microbotryum saponariae]
MNAPNEAGTTPIPAEKRHLALASRAKPVRMNLMLLLHMIFVVLPYAFVKLPLEIILSHIILRFRSKMVHLIGRPWYADYVRRLTQFVLSRTTTAQARVIFNRTNAYTLAYAGVAFIGYKDWVTQISVNGTTGGGFLLDTGGNTQNYFLYLAKELNLRRKVKFSIFQLDYELAPEFVFPSQLIEVQAGYHYLVNNQGIDPKKIVVAGDSAGQSFAELLLPPPCAGLTQKTKQKTSHAGGNLATTWLLHVARPCSSITVPESLGPTPPRPAGAFLISPMVDLCSYRPSRKANNKYDFIDNGGAFRAALEYIGVPNSAPIGVPSWNPIHFFQFPNAHPPRGFNKAPKFVAGKEAKGLELLGSPYANPIVCEDLEWLKEAFPDDGRTLISWGGMEVFNDDIEEIFKRMEKAGVAPAKSFKPLGAHDWILFDSFIPGLHKTHSFGPDRVATHNTSVASAKQDVKLAPQARAQASVPNPEPKTEKVMAPAEETQAKAPSGTTPAKGGKGTKAGQGETKEKSLEGSGVMVGREWGKE